MSSQSPQRSRKAQSYTGTTGQPPREMSPSPTLRDRQRTSKTQSMPLAPAIMQVYSGQQGSQRQGQQPSPTMSNASAPPRRSSPPSNLQMAPTSKLSSPPHSAHSVDPSHERLTPPPPPVHSHSQSNIHHTVPPPPQPQQAHSQPNIHAIPPNPQMGYPRPVTRVPPPQFLMEKDWHITDELLADIDRADFQQTQGHHASPSSGTAGVAYAGGAASASMLYSRVESGSSPKDPGVERIKVNERSSPKDSDGGPGSSGTVSRRWDRERDNQTTRDSPKNREKPTQSTAQRVSPTSYTTQTPYGQSQSPERRSSPQQYHTPLSTPGEHPAGYPQYKRGDGYIPPPQMQRMSTPPIIRRGSMASSNAEPIRTTPPITGKLASQTPPLQAIKTRTPDRSLPVQEEPEEDVSNSKNGTRDQERWDNRERVHNEHDGLVSPTPSSDLHPEGHDSRYEVSRDHGGRGSRIGRREHDDDDETLFEQDGDGQRRHDNKRDEDESYTPRSPVSNLPDDMHGRAYAPPNATIRPSAQVKHRNGSTDQLGLRGFEQVAFESSQTESQNRHKDDQPRYVPQPVRRYDNERQHDARYMNYPHPDDLQSMLDDPAIAFFQQYYQSPRPNAPIPPTPHSQTAAPSPSPLVSSMQSVAKDLPPFSPVPPIGSPYPFPFSHVRRSHTFSGHPSHPAPSSSYDPNHPSAIEEQIALQMQMYALNNHIPMSDSTLSPSSTPFPPPGYNPFAFMQAKLLGRRPPGATVSLQSSPSHEPIPLPPPPTRGRGLKKREKSMNLRGQGQVVQKVPPPRVDSTQPRETSPEPYSSGEETAGEERYEVAEEHHWDNGIIDDDNDWVDDDDDAEDEDFLQLEYHPTFIGNVDKRRRRWETRWETLKEAFQVLDRQTDATLVLMASPSHSTKLHMVASRSIRRDNTLLKSAAVSNMRTAFRHVASHRRTARSHKSTLAERLLLASSSSADGSEGSSESREEDLRRALEAALGSLGAVTSIYHQREARWRDEMLKVTEDREKVEMLMKQAFGPGSMDVNGSVGRAL